jgi:hypothetical protein
MTIPKFLLFECLDRKARDVLISQMPDNWKPPHDDKFGGIRQIPVEVITIDEQEEIRLEREVRPIMTATPERVRHWKKE